MWRELTNDSYGKKDEPWKTITTDNKKKMEEWVKYFHNQWMSSEEQKELWNQYEQMTRTNNYAEADNRTANDLFGVHSYLFHFIAKLRFVSAVAQARHQQIRKWGVNRNRKQKNRDKDMQLEKVTADFVKRMDELHEVQVDGQISDESLQKKRRTARQLFLGQCSKAMKFDFTAVWRRVLAEDSSEIKADDQKGEDEDEGDSMDAPQPELQQPANKKRRIKSPTK